MYQHVQKYKIIMNNVHKCEFFSIIIKNYFVFPAFWRTFAC